MVVAELEVFHSRPIAPTRRVALGDSALPLDPHPGPGAVLLGAVMAAHIGAVPEDLHDELDRLMLDVEAGRRIAQPRLRHRFQADRIGLQRSVHRLVGRGERLSIELDDRGAPVQQALAAVYAVGEFAPSQRRPVMDIVRRGAHWRGDVDQLLLAHLSGKADARSWVSITGDPRVWACEVFGLATFGDEAELDRREVQRRFRQLLRDAHPDHGGASDQAARRIAELAEARRILLA
jgi:hypothetical protein